MKVARNKIYIIGAAFAALLLSLTWLYYNPAGTPITELAEVNREHNLPVSSRVISSEDLPPDGTRSLFDHLVEQNQGLPYPFADLLQMLENIDPSGTPPHSMLIPHGRSLLKGLADFQRPRVLATSDFSQENDGQHLGLHTSGKLFLGFVENANEIEVISYNELAGRMEFQLVQNYCENCVPRIVYARRAICATCHQGAATVFPQRPWNESNAHPEMAQAIARARGSEDDYNGVKIRTLLETPERYDELTDVGNYLVSTQKLWLDGCGEDGANCRRQMLKLAMQYLFNPGRFDDNSKAAKQLKDLQQPAYASLQNANIVTESPWISIPEPDLRNRNPLAERSGITGWFRSLFSREIQFGEGAKNNEDLSAFDRLPALKKDLDPLTLRMPRQKLTANDIDGVYGLAGYFTESDMEVLEKKYNYDVNKLMNAVQNIPDDFFKPAPFSRVQVMKQLVNKNYDHYALHTEQMSPPVVSGVPPLEIDKLTELHNFEKYCFACHRGNPAANLNFMAGETEEEVLENIRSVDSIKDALDWERYQGTDKAAKLMPPVDSSQYELMLKEKDLGEKARTEMLDAMPELFDF